MRRADLKSFVGLVGLLLMAGCTTQHYRYVPTDDGGKVSRERSEVTYRVPPEAPQVTVRIVSQGIVELKPQESEKEKKNVSAMHLRMALSNQGKHSWFFDAREQFAVFPNHARIPPLYVNSDSSTVPSVEIKPGDLRTLDFYFPLPSDLKSDKELPEFDFAWQLKEGSRVVKETTHFGRQPVPESSAVVYPYGAYYPYGYGWGYGLGWGPSWWGGTGVGLGQ